MLNTGMHPEKIPHYYYGQYTLKIWKIVEDHVTDFVNLYYTSDQVSLILLKGYSFKLFVFVQFFLYKIF